jgi:hypothetical protein
LLASLLEICLDAAQNGAQVCAGLYCLIYGAFVASHIQLRKRPMAGLGFRSALPVGCYYVLATLLVVLGVATFVDSAGQVLVRILLLALITTVAAVSAVNVARSRRASAVVEA